MTLLSQRERFTIGDGETRRKTARARGTFPFNPLPPRHLSRQKYVNPPFINPYITAPYGGRDESHGTKDKRGLSVFASAEERRKTFSSSPPSQTFFPSQPLLDENPSVERIPCSPTFLGYVTFTAPTLHLPRSKMLRFVWDSPTP